MFEQFGLGNDDIIFLVILSVGGCIISFWLKKIYMRIKQIAKITEHFLRLDREKE